MNLNFNSICNSMKCKFNGYQTKNNKFDAKQKFVIRGVIEIVTSFVSRILMCIKAVNVSEYTIAIKKMKNRVVHEFEMNCLKVLFKSASSEMKTKMPLLIIVKLQIHFD